MATLAPAGTSGKYQDIVGFLESRSAAQVAHVGVTLLEHLQGTYELLREWGNSPDLCHAGLCHALYGTDGLQVALLDVQRERSVLADVIGRAAEALVYFYASCDRAFLYPQLGISEPLTFRDRFTGAIFEPDPAVFSAFMELTFANELEMFRRDPVLVERHQATWGTRFDRSQRYVSAPAVGCFLSVFGGPERRPV
jgi:hypothetical protein